MPLKVLLSKVGDTEGNILNWIQDCLPNSKQRAHKMGHFRDDKLTKGVQRVSVLGYELFMICINDLEGGSENMVTKFADDTKISGIASCEQHSKSL